MTTAPPPLPLPRDVDEKKRLWQLVFAVWVSFANSALYGVTSYTSPILRAAPYNFTQSDLALVGSLAGVFVSFGLPTGYVYDKYGSAVCLRVGAALALVGYTMYALMFYGVIPLTLTTLILAAIPCNQYVNYFETGSFVTNLATFARDKGTVILVEETFGGAILASWYVGFFHRDAHIVLALLPALCPLLVLIASFFIEKPSIDEELIPWHGHKRFIVAYAIVGTALVFYTGKAMVGNFVTFSHSVEVGFAVFGVVLVLSYILVPLTLNGRGFKDPNAQNGSFSFASLNVLENEPDDENHDSMHNGQLSGPGALQEEEVDEDDEKHVGCRPDAVIVPTGETTGLLLSSATATAKKTKPLTMGRMLRTPELWLVVVISFVSWGVNGMIGNNQAQIYQALNNGTLDKTTNALYISAGSISFSLGRAAVALLDSRVRNKAALLCVALPCGGLGALLVAVLPLKGLIVGVSLSSFGAAMFSASRALVLKQLFNGPGFGMVYNFLVTTYIPVPFVFNLWFFASVYDQHTVKLTGSVHGICPARQCISLQMLIGAGLSLIGAVAAALLWYRNRRRLCCRALRKQRARKQH